jgi:hypothetical protein
MAPGDANRPRSNGWLYLPLIIGLAIGAGVATMTGQWWWTTIGVLLGALAGTVSALKMSGRKSDD